MKRLHFDVQAYINTFLGSKDQAALRRTSQRFCDAFTHAFQLGFITCAIHDGYVDSVERLFDCFADPLRVAPVDPFEVMEPRRRDWLRDWIRDHSDLECLGDSRTYEEQSAHFRYLCLSNVEARSSNDSKATIVVNVKMLLETKFPTSWRRPEKQQDTHEEGSFDEDEDEDDSNNKKPTTTTAQSNAASKKPAPTRLLDYFLHRVPFKAVHFVETDTLEEIGNSVVSSCDNLSCFTITTPCPRLRIAQSAWLSCNERLLHVDFSGCCVNLEEEDQYEERDDDDDEGQGYGGLLPQRRKQKEPRKLLGLEKVGAFWLGDCPSLGHVSFRGCENVKSVMGKWMNGCSALRTVDLSPLVSLQSAGICWMAKCHSLLDVDLNALEEIETIGGSFLVDCTELRSCLLGKCSKLKTIGPNWLDKSTTNLRQLQLPGEYNKSRSDEEEGWARSCVAQFDTFTCKQLAKLLEKMPKE